MSPSPMEPNMKKKKKKKKKKQQHQEEEEAENASNEEREDEEEAEEDVRAVNSHGEEEGDGAPKKKRKGSSMMTSEPFSKLPISEPTMAATKERCFETMTQSFRAPSTSVHFSQSSQESVRVEESVVRHVADLRDEMLRRIAQQPHTGDATLIARFDMLERSITDLVASKEHSITGLIASTERNVTVLQGMQVAMDDQLMRMQDSVAQGSSRLVSVMDSYNVRLLALEQIYLPGPPGSIPTPLITLPPSSTSVTLSQEQYNFLLSQMRSGVPSSDQQ